jgi:hypothetical protein
MDMATMQHNYNCKRYIIMIIFDENIFQFNMPCSCIVSSYRTSSVVSLYSLPLGAFSVCSYCVQREMALDAKSALFPTLPSPQFRDLLCVKVEGESCSLVLSPSFNHVYNIIIRMRSLFL